MSEKYPLREKSGLLFRNNDGLKKNPKAPTYRGSMLLEGKAQNVSMWKKESQSGDEYFAFDIQQRDESFSKRPPSPTPQQPAPKPQEELPLVPPPPDDDVPF